MSFLQHYNEPMSNIVHRVGIKNTTRQKVYKALATKEGIESWWTIQVNGISKEGNVMHFKFGSGGPNFKIIKLEPAKKVVWKCISGPSEWVDTFVEFNIYEQNEEIILLFKHAEWKEEAEFMNHCSTQWAYFLIGLKNKLAGIGEAKPFGSNQFEPISDWSK